MNSCWVIHVDVMIIATIPNPGESYVLKLFLPFSSNVLLFSGILQTLSVKPDLPMSHKTGNCEIVYRKPCNLFVLDSTNQPETSSDPSTSKGKPSSWLKFLQFYNTWKLTFSYLVV